MTANTRRLVSAGLWMVAAVSLTAILVRYLRNPDGYDLKVIIAGVTRFIDHQPVYSAAGYGRYLYPPSSLLLLWPLGVIGFAHVHAAYMLLEAASLMTAVYLSLRLFHISLRSPLAAAAFCAAILSAPVIDELRWSNVDGLLLSLFVASLLAMDRGRWMLAAILLGFTFALKPTVIPVVLVLLLWRQYRATAVALAIPAALLVAGTLVAPDGMHFFSATLPILAQGLGHDLSGGNIALVAVFASLGVSPLVAAALRLAVLGVILASAWRAWRSPLPNGQKLTALVGLILLTIYLDSSYSYLRYVIYLLPALVMLALYRSRLPFALAMAGLLALMLPYSRALDNQFVAVHEFDLYRFTIGCLLVLSGLVVWVWTRPVAEPEAEATRVDAPLTPELALTVQRS